MDEVMQDGRPSPSRNRKRTSAWIDDDSFASDDVASPEAEYTPSKRLLNARGEAIQTTRVIKYNAQKLLNHLAFTRVYVTANFENYNPNSSFIILCMVAGQDEMFQILCQRLPSLYDVAPSLQALAITDGFLESNAIPDQSLLRKLPLVTTAGMEISVAEEFQAFHRHIGSNEGSIAVIDPRGVCVWYSAERAADKIATDFEMLWKLLFDASTTLESREVDMHDG